MRGCRWLSLFMIAAVALGACATPAAVTPTMAPTAAATALPAATATPAASGAATPAGLAGCVPACVNGYSAPGDLPAGEYQTRYFFGHQMKVTLQAGWTSTEDSNGEFGLAPKATPEDEVKFWEDVYPLNQGTRVAGVSQTAEGLLHWLATDKNFTTSAPVAGKIGQNIPATVVDVSIANGAINDDPTCPAATCLNFFGYPQWNENWGIAGNQVQRLYLANVSYGGAQHLFVVVIYPDKPENMQRLRTLAEPVIASVRVPVDVP